MWAASVSRHIPRHGKLYSLFTGYAFITSDIQDRGLAGLAVMPTTLSTKRESKKERERERERASEREG
jgi:hypothetical protein